MKETNKYASKVINAKDGNTRGGGDWRPLGLEEFQVYIGLCLLMGLKKLPSRCLYWSQDQPLFKCPIISNL